jgi:flagellar hook-associated protein 3 FlgL
MAVTRISQNQIMNNSFRSMQAAANRVSKVQEQMTTGKVINRASDNPAEAAAAMRIRAEQAKQEQFSANSSDGLAWLNQTDGTIQSMLDQVQRARTLALQGASSASMSPAARTGLVAEINQIRESLITQANTTYLDRPLFGGLTAGTSAYNPNGTLAQPAAAGAVNRVIADGVALQINVNGADVFGPDGANVFDELSKMSAALTAGDSPAILDGLGNLQTFISKFTTTLADVGARTNRIEAAQLQAEDLVLTLRSRLSDTENLDLAKGAVDLQLAEVAYQASLAAVSRAVQPSLLDFIR